MRLERLEKGIVLVVVGDRVVIVCGMAAAAYRAQAASCADPVTGWRCSQTPGSDWESAAKVLNALTLAGASLTAAGFCLAGRGRHFAAKELLEQRKDKSPVCLPRE